MINSFKRLSMVPRSLRYKLIVAFSLMSIIPLLVCAYLVSNYIFPNVENIGDISLIIILSLSIAILGFVLAKRFIDPVIGIAIEAKMIARGDYDKKITAVTDDEIGNIADSINSMTHMIRLNMEELKSYGQKTREINIDIHQKVLALSSLLQIGDLLSANTMELPGILELAVQKAAAMFDTGFGALYLAKEAGGDFILNTAYNLNEGKLADLVIKPGHGFLGKATEGNIPVVVDSGAGMTNEAELFKTTYEVKNTLAIPMYSGKKPLGVLVVGNRLDDFKYKADDIDLIKVFAKQMAIAIENNILLKKAEELSIVDDLTGLYNKSYILTRLEEELKRGIFYQRPCSFLIFNIDDFKIFRDANGELISEEILKKMARIIKDSTDPAGKAARIGGDEFAMLLPEKNKKEAMHIAEDLRRKVEATNFLKEGKANMTVCGGVSENPIDGATKEELFKKAQDALRRAKALGKNRVEA